MAYREKLKSEQRNQKAMAILQTKEEEITSLKSVSEREGGVWPRGLGARLGGVLL